MKTRSPTPSLSFKGQATKQGPVNGSIVNVMLILLSLFFVFVFRFCSHYRSPMHAAAFNDQVECIQLLLSRGGNVDAVDQSGTTPLIMAAENGHAGAVGECRLISPVFPVRREL